LALSRRPCRMTASGLLPARIGLVFVVLGAGSVGTMNNLNRAGTLGPPLSRPVASCLLATRLPLAIHLLGHRNLFNSG
jgi:hypothetical protein